MNWLYKKDKHYTRFFNTNWNSKLSLIRYHAKPIKNNGFQFREGYMEFTLGRWKLRYKNWK